MTAAENTQISTLRSLLLSEIFGAFGLPREGWLRRHFWPLFWLPAQVFSTVSMRFDEMVASQGLDAAAGWILPRLVKNVLTTGDQHIPEEGPLLVVSNHPGSVDSLVIASQIHRPDFRIVASAIPYLMHMPATSRHMIFTPRDPIDRMGVIRESISHLKNGGAMLIFPSGHMDPDPCVHTGLQANFSEWSRSIELFLRKVPDTQLVISMVSNVVGHNFFHNPLTRLRKRLLDRQKLAEFIQNMQQLVLPGSVNISPRISFHLPAGMEKLQTRMDQSLQSMQSIADRASLAFAEHMNSRFRHWTPSQS